MLTPSALTFKSISEAYTSALHANPGQALSYSSFAVVLIRGGQLTLALMSGGMIDLGNSVALNEARWDQSRGCWTDHASSEVSAATVNIPDMVEVNCKTVKSFNAGDICFEFEGDEIKDPTISECGRFGVEPSHYGFTHRTPGIWELGLPDGTQIQLCENILTLHDHAGDIVGRVLLSEIEFEGDIDDEIPSVPNLAETLANAARTSSGMIEYPVPSRTADAVAEGFRLGLFEIIGNGVAQITGAGKHQAAQTPKENGRA